MGINNFNDEKSNIENNRKIQIKNTINDILINKYKIDELSYSSKVEKKENNENSNDGFEDEETNNFDKMICLSNIRELLNNSDIKIGEIEREAGCQLGYMSRLEKEGNNTSPSISFVLTAAKMFDTSVDVLLTYDLTKMDSTDKFLIKLYDKLINDTLKNKIEWEKHSPSEYSNAMSISYENELWPLFKRKANYSDYKKRGFFVCNTIFNSKTFGDNSLIRDDCYEIKMGKQSKLFLMNIIKAEHSEHEQNITAKEIWMTIQGYSPQYLGGDKSNKSTSKIVDQLFAVVKGSFDTPKIKKEFKSVIEEYMKK